MIGRLKGIISEVAEDHCLLEVSGVGYEVSCSAQTLATLPPGELAQLLIHTHVKEDQFSLFGFLTHNEKKLFLSLLKVNGIGPKMAMAVLSAAPVDEIISYIESKDIKALTGLPRVGKKTAEQMILSLKGQLVSDPQFTPAAPSSSQKVRSEVISALVNLGFRLSDIEEVFRDQPLPENVEAGIRMGLSRLSRT